MRNYFSYRPPGTGKIWKNFTENQKKNLPGNPNF
jgi:hypothetical protein